MPQRQYAQFQDSGYAGQTQDDDYRVPSTPIALRAGQFSIGYIPNDASNYVGVRCIASVDTPVGVLAFYLYWDGDAETDTNVHVSFDGTILATSNALTFSARQELSLEFSGPAGRITVAGATTGNGATTGTSWACLGGELRLGGLVDGADLARGWVSLPYAVSGAEDTDDAPTITAITPNTGPLAGGTAVSVTGTGLRAGTSVTVRGVTLTNVVYWDGDTEIQGNVAAGAVDGDVDAALALGDDSLDVDVAIAGAYGSSTLAGGYTYSIDFIALAGSTRRLFRDASAGVTQSPAGEVTEWTHPSDAFVLSMSSSSNKGTYTAANASVGNQPTVNGVSTRPTTLRASGAGGSIIAAGERPYILFAGRCSVLAHGVNASVFNLRSAAGTTLVEFGWQDALYHFVNGSTFINGTGAPDTIKHVFEDWLDTEAFKNHHFWLDGVAVKEAGTLSGIAADCDQVSYGSNYANTKECDCEGAYLLVCETTNMTAQMRLNLRRLAAIKIGSALP